MALNGRDVPFRPAPLHDIHLAWMMWAGAGSDSARRIDWKTAGAVIPPSSAPIRAHVRGRPRCGEGSPPGRVYTAGIQGRRFLRLTVALPAFALLQLLGELLLLILLGASKPDILLMAARILRLCHPGTLLALAHASFLNDWVYLILAIQPQA